MKSPRTRWPQVVGALGLCLGPPLVASAQQAATADAGRLASREALDAYYDRQIREMDVRRIKDLAELAGKSAKDVAEGCYREAFDLARVHNLYEAADPAAIRYIGSESPAPDLRAMATSVHANAQADRKDFDGALATIEAYIKAQKPADPADKSPSKPDPNLMFAVIESFLVRLGNEGRYSQTHKIASMLESFPDPAVKQFYRDRLVHIEMVGKPAPPIAAKDVDGKAVRLEDYKGKVVLVDFWATWYPSLGYDFAILKQLTEQHGPKGFAVLGVNVDGANPANKDQAKVTSAVRRALIDARATWTNVMDTPGKGDLTKPYRVTNLPANFLIDREGKIIHVELVGQELPKAVAEAMGVSKPAAAAAK